MRLKSKITLNPSLKDLTIYVDEDSLLDTQKTHVSKVKSKGKDATK